MSFTIRRLLEELLEHHKRSRDSKGVSILTEALTQLETSGTISGGLGDYVFNRIAPQGLYPDYYKTVWVLGSKRKAKSDCVEFFKQNVERLLERTQPHHFKEETKVKAKGNPSAFDEWVDEVLYKFEVSELQSLLNTINNKTGMKQLEQQQKIVLLKAIGFYFMSVGKLSQTDLWVLIGLKKFYLR